MKVRTCDPKWIYSKNDHSPATKYIVRIRPECMTQVYCPSTRPLPVRPKHSALFWELGSNGPSSTLIIYCRLESASVKCKSRGSEAARGEKHT